MNNKFITCFWDGPSVTQKRIKLCQDFVNRYPNVTLLINGNVNIVSDNYIKYNFDTNDFGTQFLMINQYLSEYGPSLDSLTLLDSDIILEPLFFYKIIKKHETLEQLPTLLSYKNSYELFNGRILNTIVRSKISDGTRGHTGFVLSFNKLLLKELVFETCYTFGGYDYILTNGLLKKTQDYKDSLMVKRSLEKLSEINAFCDYVDTDIIHNEHGPKSERMTPWHRYA